MTKSKISLVAALGLAITATAGNTGCNTDLTALVRELNNLDLSGLLGSINQIQTRDPRDPDFFIPGDRELNLGEEVDVITDIENQLGPDGFEERMLLGFENVSGFDMYVEYEVDGFPQSIFVFDGETLFLDYPCPESIEVTLEEDYDPIGYTIMNTIDWTGTEFTSENEDFDCAQALLITMDGVSVNANAETFDLLPPPPPPGPGGPTDPFDPFDPMDPMDPFDPMDPDNF